MGIRRLENFSDIFSRFRTISDRDRQTNGQTSFDSTTRTLPNKDPVL